MSTKEYKDQLATLAINPAYTGDISKNSEKNNPTQSPVHIGQLKSSFRNSDLENINDLTGSKRELPTIPAVAPQEASRNIKKSTKFISSF
jgi:hypothetical protein